MNARAAFTEPPLIDDADPAEAAHCANLWREVLLAAIADAEADKPDARAWIGSHDFLTVADLAAVDRDAAADWAAVQQRRWAQETETTE